jgi:hypothetical protein
MLNIPAEYDTRYFTTKINGQFSPTFSLLHNCASAGIYQRALAEESGMIRTQMEMHNNQKMAAVHGTLCMTPPHNSDQ